MMLQRLMVAAVVLFAGIQVLAEDGNKVAQVVGLVKAVDDKAGSITLEGRKSEGGNVGAPMTYKLAQGAKVMVNGEAKGLKDVAAGAKATLKLDANKNVTEITIDVKKGKEGNG
jgi:hypothetical protein